MSKTPMTCDDMAPDSWVPRTLIINAMIWISLIWLVPVAIAGTGANDFSWADIFIGLAGGLAFFLYGMEKMSTGMKNTAGNRMRTLLATLTKNRVIAMIVGAFVTMVIQSSSATTVMLVSFVQAGLLTLVQSMGVILGADIGTTITAQMIAFKLTDYALLMVAIGFAMKLAGKTERAKSVGDIILGFGILFFGMKLMSDAMNPLRSFPAFINLMKDLENPFMGILFGTAFTAVVQSSSATTGVLIVLAQQGLISLEAGIPVIFGANIGTCVTAALAGIGASREAKRVAIAHILFKVAGVFLFIFWIPQFADLI
ncbi:MAG: Na/Pi symporter, partial [Proteobacteria bacterium]|nr:Na/Pi symporter [Pseudomonadota bacterium]